MNAASALRLGFPATARDRSRHVYSRTASRRAAASRSPVAAGLACRHARAFLRECLTAHVVPCAPRAEEYIMPNNHKDLRAKDLRVNGYQNKVDGKRPGQEVDHMWELQHAAEHVHHRPNWNDDDTADFRRLLNGRDNLWAVEKEKNREWGRNMQDHLKHDGDLNRSACVKNERGIDNLLRHQSARPHVKEALRSAKARF